MLSIALAAGLAAGPALGNTGSGWLRRVQGARVDGQEELVLEFASPIRLRAHAPAGAARQHDIELVPVDLGSDAALLPRRRESVPVPPERTSLLREAVVEPIGEDAVLVILRFSQPVRLEVVPDAGFRALRVRLAPPPGARAGGRGALLLAEARGSLTRGELPRAIALLTKLLEHPDDASPEAARDAHELLALARERNGQLAHARAEYEAYLERHPDGAGAIRVRQRLAALATRTAAPSPALRGETEGEPSRLYPEMYGSLSASYARYQDVLLDGQAFDSSAETDLLLNARAEPGGRVLESEAAGSYRMDLLDDTASEARVTSLFVSLEDPALDLQGTVGRQRPRGGGLLSRVDGGQLRGPLAGGVYWRAVAGLPVVSSDARLESDRQLFSLALESRELPLGLEGEVFSNVQRADGFLDRAAVGAEVRWLGAGRHVLAYTDYDALFASLNTALLTGSQQLGDATLVSAQAAVRNAPVITLRSALQGQGTDRLADLSTRFDEAELRALAQDRTARLWSGTAGVSHRQHRDLQIGLDGFVSSLSGTPASGDVAETQASGVEGGATARATVSRWLSRSDVHTVTLGGHGGESGWTLRGSLASRQTLVRSLTVSPRLRVQHHEPASSSAPSLTLHPAVGLDYRWRDFRVDATFGAEYTHRFEGVDPDDLALFGELVVRLDF